MGTTTRVCSLILRLGELASAIIVVSIVGRFLFLLDEANANANSHVIYTEVIAGISIILAIILAPPLKYSFYCFSLDFTLFICWMVAFGLLCNVSYSVGPVAE